MSDGGSVGSLSSIIDQQNRAPLLQNYFELCKCSVCTTIIIHRNHLVIQKSFSYSE